MAHSHTSQGNRYKTRSHSKSPDIRRLQTSSSPCIQADHHPHFFIACSVCYALAPATDAAVSGVAFASNRGDRHADGRARDARGRVPSIPDERNDCSNGYCGFEHPPKVIVLLTFPISRGAASFSPDWPNTRLKGAPYVCSNYRQSSPASGRHPRGSPASVARLVNGHQGRGFSGCVAYNITKPSNTQHLLLNTSSSSRPSLRNN